MCLCGLFRGWEGSVLFVAYNIQCVSLPWCSLQGITYLSLTVCIWCCFMYINFVCVGTDYRFDVRKGLHRGGLSSGWSFIRVVLSGWFFTMMVFHQCGLLLGWSFIRVVCHQGGLSSRWSFIRVIFYQDGFIRFVFHYDCLSSVWSLTRVVFHQVNGLSSKWSSIRCMVWSGWSLTGWSFVRVVFCEGGFSSGWSFTRWSFVKVVSHQGGLAPGFSLSVLCAGSWEKTTADQSQAGSVQQKLQAALAEQNQEQTVSLLLLFFLVVGKQ